MGDMGCARKRRCGCKPGWRRRGALRTGDSIRSWPGVNAVPSSRYGMPRMSPQCPHAVEPLQSPMPSSRYCLQSRDPAPSLALPGGPTDRI